MGTDSTYDYVIVGAGAGGCVLANRLSANPAAKVLLLEAGIADDAPEFLDARAVIQTWKKEYDWGYSSEPVPGLNNRKIGLIRGKVLGGSTSVHAMLHVRGNRRDFDAWNHLGNEGWSYKDVLPYFIKSEAFGDGASAYHGANGPLSVISNPVMTEVSTAFCQAATNLGFAGPAWDYNGERQENSVGPYQLVCTKDLKRASASYAFLRPIRGRSNLTVLTGAEATRVLLEKGVAKGVEYVQGGKTLRANAAREVLLCGGSYHTPKLMMLSGLGPAEALKKHGITVAADLQGVGNNLIDHVLLMLIFKSKKAIPDPAFIAEAGMYAYSQEGMEAASPDMQINFNAGVHALAPPDIGQFFSFVSVLVQPQSRGFVTLRSANPADAPVIQPNYLACDSDYRVLRSALDLSRRIAATKPLSEFSNGEINLGADKSEAEISQFIRNNASTIWHPVGTCRMGHDSLAVVDPALRVHGVERLRIADASVMPTITAGNTAAATMMIGEKAADMILQNTK